MTIASGFADLQIDANDKTKTQRFKLSSHSKSKKIAKQKAEALRNKGKKARIVFDSGENEYAVYVRG